MKSVCKISHSEFVSKSSLRLSESDCKQSDQSQSRSSRGLSHKEYLFSLLLFWELPGGMQFLTIFILKSFLLELLNFWVRDVAPHSPANWTHFTEGKARQKGEHVLAISSRSARTSTSDEDELRWDLNCRKECDILWCCDIGQMMMMSHDIVEIASATKKKMYSMLLSLFWLVVVVDCELLWHFRSSQAFCRQPTRSTELQIALEI